MTQPRHSRVIRADELETRHMGRHVRIGDVTGTLAGLLPVANTVTVVLIVGGARAFFQLTADAQVEHWKADT